MKLADQCGPVGPYVDINARGPKFVLEHLVVLGLEELASFDFWDEGVQRFYVAADLGLYLAVFTPRQDIRFDPKLEGVVRPWPEVGRVHLGIRGLTADRIVATLNIDDPVFERSADRAPDIERLVEFGRACLQRQGRRRVAG